MTIIRNTLAVTALAGLALAAGCGGSGNASSSPSPGASATANLSNATSDSTTKGPTSLTIALKAQKSSGESGTATLTQATDGVKVVVSLKHATGTQPTHIHEGTCAKLTPAPKWPLSNTVNGQGTTTVSGVTIAQLLAGKYAINVHKSASDLKDYVACGNIAQSK